MDLPSVYLKKREQARVRAGHPWVFSNEVEGERSPLSGFEAGQMVAIQSHSGAFIGAAYINPHSLILARMVSRTPGETLDRQLIQRRLQQALALREQLFVQPFYRLVFGESDGLPGLVVDRYDAILVVQIITAGMERVRDDVLAALDAVLAPKAVVFRNDVPSRKLEGLDRYVETPMGAAPETTVVEEHGARFEVSLLEGQKTGWYFDQRPNRARLVDYARGRRVLDTFSYCGAWGIQAALGGAREVICVDTSEAALRSVRRNARLNGVEQTVASVHGDVFEVLKGLHAEGERFGTVVLDPPAFIRRRKDISAGIEAYRRLNRLAMRLLEPDGILISSSCSTHLRRDKLQESLVQAARLYHRELQLLEEGHQGPDHPVHPALPESGYLKVFFARAFAP
ncbi:MAG: class I SAM-dependent rRNA methyltransferase [Gammaproteobacteria bacterium]